MQYPCTAEGAAVNRSAFSEAHKARIPEQNILLRICQWMPQIKGIDIISKMIVLRSMHRHIRPLFPFDLR